MEENKKSEEPQLVARTYKKMMNYYFYINIFYIIIFFGGFQRNFLFYSVTFGKLPIEHHFNVLVGIFQCALHNH